MSKIPTSRPVRVLIVDDSLTIRAMVDRLIEVADGMKVIGITACADEARQFCRDHDPDVITLDIEMPGINGLDFLADLMATRPIPVVMLSSHTKRGADNCDRALSLGAAACFDKAEVLTNAKGLIATLRKAAKGKKRLIGEIDRT